MIFLDILIVAVVCGAFYGYAKWTATGQAITLLIEQGIADRAAEAKRAAEKKR